MTDFVAASSSSETGLITLGAVVLGGVLTAVLTEVRDRARARKERDQARRLASADLERASEALKDVRARMDQLRDWTLGDKNEDRKWPPGWERAGWSEAWEGYRGGLANGLDAAVFATVARAFGSLGQFQNSLAAGERTFVKNDRPFVDRVERRVTAALEVLPPPDKALTEDLGPAGDGT